MVRLKFPGNEKHIEANQFQFLNGAIKIQEDSLASLSLLHFNSLMVRLKLPNLVVQEELFTYFNSLMVRLKLGSNRQTIDTDYYFNSLMVRLKSV